MNPHPQLETSRIKYRFTSSLCPSKIKVFWAIEKQSAPLSAFPRATEETKSKYVHWSRDCKLWPQLRYMRPEYSTQHPTQYLYTKPLMCMRHSSLWAITTRHLTVVQPAQTLWLVHSLQEVHEEADQRCTGREPDIERNLCLGRYANCSQKQ